MLFGVEVQRLRAAFLHAHAALDVRVRQREIRLRHVDGRGAVFVGKRRHVGHGDKVLALLRHRLDLAHGAVNFAQGALDFIVEICVVVDDAQIRVRAPRAQRAVVHLAREFDGFRARVVAEVIGELRALGAGDEMEHHVVIGEYTLFGAAVKARDDLRELLIRHVGLVVHQRAVVENENIVLRHELRGIQCELFLVDLIADDKVLKLQHRHTVVKGLDAKARNELSCRLGDRDDAPAVLLLEFLEHTAHERGFARRGAAREDDLCDALCHSYASFPCRR